MIANTKTDLASKNHALPSRFKPYDDVFGKQPAWLKQTLGRMLHPSREKWQEMGQALMQGDPLMDAWVAWMFANEPSNARKLFDTALHKGIDTVPNAPEPLKALFHHVDNDPHWLDRRQFHQATNTMQKAGITSNYVLRDMSLMSGYLLSDFNQALVLTGALHKGVRQRIAETSKWWLEVSAANGMTRFSSGFKSTLHVRLVHALVRRNIPKKPEWQTHTWGIPINQLDMFATNCAFSNLYIIGLRAFGMPVGIKEAKAVLHFWKYVGWLMGIDEKWLKEDELSANILFYQAMQTFSEPDWTSQALGSALAEEIKAYSLPHLKHRPKLHDAVLEYIYQLHLSNSALFLSKKKRRQLGLPENIYPWFPVLTMLPRAGKYTLAYLSSKRNKTLIRKGRKQQEMTVNYLFGDNAHKLVEPETLATD